MRFRRASNHCLVPTEGKILRSGIHEERGTGTESVQRVEVVVWAVRSPTDGVHRDQIAVFGRDVVDEGSGRIACQDENCFPALPNSHN